MPFLISWNSGVFGSINQPSTQSTATRAGRSRAGRPSGSTTPLRRGRGGRWGWFPVHEHLCGVCLAASKAIRSMSDSLLAPSSHVAAPVMEETSGAGLGRTLGMLPAPSAGAGSTPAVLHMCLGVAIVIVFGAVAAQYQYGRIFCSGHRCGWQAPSTAAATTTRVPTPASLVSLSEVYSQSSER